MTTSHPRKKKPEEIERQPLRQIEMSQEDWEEFERGVKLFNDGKYWHSHEAWEQVWRRHSEDERLFFQGVIQLAAACHQIAAHRPPQGILNNFDKASEKLTVFAPQYLGVEVAPLLQFIEEGKEEIGRLGAKGVAHFDLMRIPRIQFHKPISLDLVTEVKAILGSPLFAEGARLYNGGFFWEAHEAWEDLWREQHGEAKTFTQAFVQMAAAYSFVRLSRWSPALYLFEKSLEKFQQFDGFLEHCHLAVSFPHMQRMVTLLRDPATYGATRTMLDSVPHIAVNSQRETAV